MRTPNAYQRNHLLRVSNDTSSWGRLRAYMLSALIRSGHSYPALPLARQQVDQRSVQLGPLVLESIPLKYQRLQ